MSGPEPGGTTPVTGSALATTDDQPPFREQWQAQVMGLAFNLIDSGRLSNARWSEALGAALDEAARGGAPDDTETYYQAALRATSTPWAPWYCIPADDKPAMRLIVAKLLRGVLEAIDPQEPVLDAEERAEMLRLREGLVEELGGRR